jgi:glutathione S-transferase
MANTDTIYIKTYIPNPRAWKSQIVGAFNGVKVVLQNVDLGKENKTEEFLSMFPFGQVPAAYDEGKKHGMFESNSIARWVARLGEVLLRCCFFFLFFLLIFLWGNGMIQCCCFLFSLSLLHQAKYPLYGKNIHEASCIDAWLDSAISFESHVGPWIYPVLGEFFPQHQSRLTSNTFNFCHLFFFLCCSSFKISLSPNLIFFFGFSFIAGWGPRNEEKEALSKQNVKTYLVALERHLRTRTFLVGDSVSLADIVLVADLTMPVKHLFDDNFKADIPNVMRWYNTLFAMPQFQQVLAPDLARPLSDWA